MDCLWNKEKRAKWFANFKERSRQSMLPDYDAYRPVLTKNKILLILSTWGVVCLALGIGCYLASEKVVEAKVRYDNNPDCIQNFVRNFQQPGAKHTCSVSITVPKAMKPPIHMYYNLGNYYQNYRRYTMSFNQLQYKTGKPEAKVPATSQNSCAPIGLTKNGTAYPCGLIAWSFFNDTYSLTGPQNQPITVQENQIASNFDRKLYSKEPPNAAYQNGPWPQGGGKFDTPVNENDHFIIWMKPSISANFRKLWGKINQPLEAGTYNLSIESHYNTYIFNGQKSIVLSTSSFIGDKNPTMGIAYLAVGALAILSMVVYVFASLIFKGRIEKVMSPYNENNNNVAQMQAQQNGMNYETQQNQNPYRGNRQGQNQSPNNRDVEIFENR